MGKNFKTDEADYTRPCLESEVAIDSDNDVLKKILSDSYKYEKDDIDDIIKISTSNYEKNYLFFVKKIDELAQEDHREWEDFAVCLLHHCVVFPIECDGRDNALKTFNTLSSRGEPLSTSDIFKCIIYSKREKGKIC